MEEFAISNPIKVSEFLNECKSCRSNYDLMVTDDYADDIDLYISKDYDMRKIDYATLKHPNASDTEFQASITDSKGLKVLEQRKKELDDTTKMKKRVPERLKYVASDSPWIHYLLKAQERCHTVPENQRVKLPDVMLTAHFYKPSRRRKPHIIEQEFDILGQSTLTSLKEKLNCRSDHVAIGNFASNPDQPITVMTGDLFKSGFFFIEGTFYNDMRDQTSIDLSKTMKEWADERPDKVGPFKYTSMEGVQFIDLTLRLGQPYLFMHQGNCEHLIVFSDLRTVTDHDCMLLEKYPVETFKHRDRKPLCRVCAKNFVKWVAFKSSLSPEDPCFFCDLCFKLFHYDEHGKLLDPQLRVTPLPIWIEAHLEEEGSISSKKPEKHNNEAETTDEDSLSSSPSNPPIKRATRSSRLSASSCLSSEKTQVANGRGKKRKNNTNTKNNNKRRKKGSEIITNDDGATEPSHPVSNGVVVEAMVPDGPHSPQAKCVGEFEGKVIGDLILPKSPVSPSVIMENDGDFSLFNLNDVVDHGVNGISDINGSNSPLYKKDENW